MGGDVIFANTGPTHTRCTTCAVRGHSAVLQPLCRPHGAVLLQNAPGWTTRLESESESAVTQRKRVTLAGGGR